MQAFQRQLQDKEAALRKAKTETEKIKKDKNLLEQRIPTLESSIEEMKALVEKFANDSQREIKKRELAERKQEALAEKLSSWNEVHEQLQIEDPIKFKEDFDFVKNELTKLKKQMADRQKTMQTQETKIK
jgi:chromosome segregation ATPase